MMTWPFAVITTLLSRRTQSTVVPCICAEFFLIGIGRLYRERRLGPTRGSRLLVFRDLNCVTRYNCATGVGTSGSTPRHPTDLPCTAPITARNSTTYIIWR